MSMRFKYFLSVTCPVCASVSTPIIRDIEKVFPGICTWIYVDHYTIKSIPIRVDPRGYFHRMVSERGSVPVIVFDDVPPYFWTDANLKVSMVGVLTYDITAWTIAHRMVSIYMMERSFTLDMISKYIDKWMASSDNFIEFLETFRDSAWSGGF